MIKLLNNRSIRTRVALALALPIIGLLTFSSFLIVEQYRVSAEMTRIQSLAELAPQVSALVHELQKERGNSAGYIGGRGVGAFATRLAAQHDETDGIRERFDAAMDAFDTGAFGARFEGQVAQARSRIGRLELTRTEVRALSISVGEMAEYYTGTIARLFDIVAEMAILSNNAELTNTITAYINLLQTKERAGIERAMGANGFTNGRFAPAVHQRFIELLAQQQAFLSVFRVYATEAQREVFMQTVRGIAVDDVERMRQIAIASGYGGDTGGIAGPEWFDTITRKIDLLKTVEDSVAADLVALAVATRRSARMGLIVELVVTGALLALTAIVVFAVVRGITGPVARITQAMSSLAAGDKTVEIFGTAQQDEIGSMARALEVFKQSANEAERLAGEQIAEQKARAERAEKVEQLSAAFDGGVSSVLTTVSSSATEMRSSAESLTGTAERTSQEADRVASLSDEAADNVQTVASASEELTASISEISQQVARSADIADRAKTEASKTGATVKSLAESAQKIGDVVSLITDIAEQTNLLALNATIEAARAGEAGKGFAVVASEVKSLANQTAMATEEIATQISGMQTITSETVLAIDDMGRIIDQISEYSTAIASAVEEQQSATQEIARSVQQVATSTSEVSGSIGAVKEGASETGAAAGEVLGAAGELSQQSEALSGDVRAFLDAIKTA